MYLGVMLIVSGKNPGLPSLSDNHVDASPNLYPKVFVDSWVNEHFMVFCKKELSSKLISFHIFVQTYSTLHPFLAIG